MFTRLAQTYDFDDSLLDRIVADAANPLNRITELIPDGARVLDIGAGNGLLAQLIHKRKKNVTVDGVEPQQYAATKARGNYRRFVADIAELNDAEYDVIVLADVIEHIPDPVAFLQQVLRLAGPQTRMMLSVPNVAFGAVRLDLLAGNFRYVDSGLLERTHLRFFTLASLQQLVQSLGMNIERLYFLERDIVGSEISVQLLPQVWNAVTVFRDPLAWTYQFLLVLTRENVTTERKSFGAPRRGILRAAYRQLMDGLWRRIKSK
jgi:methionine biosynthesis protein MetW